MGTKTPRKRKYPKTTGVPDAATPTCAPPASGPAPPDKVGQSGYPSIPTPVFVSYNMNGLSADATAGELLCRRQLVVANLSALASEGADFILTQESRAKKNARIYRRLLKPAYRRYGNPNFESSY